MTPFYIAPTNRIAFAALPIVAIATGALMFHPISLNFSGGSATPSSAPAAFVSSASSTVYLSQASATSAAQTAAATDAPMLEVHIANSGLTLLRGARVTSISGGAIGLAISWGGANFAWNVHTAYGTEIFDGKGSKTTIGNIRTGDIVTVTGQLDKTTGSPSVTAQYINDQSI